MRLWRGARGLKAGRPPCTKGRGKMSVISHNDHIKRSEEAAGARIDHAAAGEKGQRGKAGAATQSEAQAGERSGGGRRACAGGRRNGTKYI